MASRGRGVQGAPTWRGPRLTGLVLVAFAVALAYLVFAPGHPVPYTPLGIPWIVLGIPFMGVTGVWLLAFGYPERADGLTPLWWRVGLLVALAMSTTLGAWVLYGD